MRAWSAIVALLVLSSAPATAQTPAWHVDVSGAALAEAWDLNGARETLIGSVIGADRHVWRALALRSEAVLARVSQRGGDAWLRGFTVGTRGRWDTSRGRPFVDVAVGLSSSTAAVPPQGTSFNYLITSGGGVEMPAGKLAIVVGLRWFHVSNNGREGRHRNPDVQAVGAVVGIGWSQ
jgi:hypothetical protein